MLAAHAREEGGDGDRAPPLLYLSTTDFVQHKYEPTEPEALDFCAHALLRSGRCPGPEGAEGGRCLTALPPP
eukprot:COSAG01_NODE_32601_length_578_cov_1.592902_1_plen_71_part_10